MKENKKQKKQKQNTKKDKTEKERDNSIDGISKVRPRKVKHISTRTLNGFSWLTDKSSCLHPCGHL